MLKIQSKGLTKTMVVKSFKIEKEIRWYRIVIEPLKGEKYIISSFVSEASAMNYINSERIKIQDENK